MRYITEVVLPSLRNKGDAIAVSQLPLDGAVPTGIGHQLQKTYPDELPVRAPEKCSQCLFCCAVCPHDAITAKLIDPKDLTDKPDDFTIVRKRGKNETDLQLRIQVDPAKCTGCGLCVQACPLKNVVLSMQKATQVNIPAEEENTAFHTALPANVLTDTIEGTVQHEQLKESFFTNPMACSGCGET